MNQIKKTFILLLVLGASFITPLKAQQDMSVHFLKTVPQNHLLRPGKMPALDGFFLFPGLSGASVGWNNNSFTFPQLNLGWDSRTADPDYEALFNNIQDLGKVTFRGTIPIFAVGIKAKNAFITFDMSDRIEGSAYFGSPYIGLNQVEDLKNYSFGDVYDLSDVDLNILHYRSYNIGFTYQINPNLNVGGRIGYTAGLESIRTENAGLSLIDLGNGLFRVSGNASVYSSGIGRLEGKEEFNAGSYIFNFSNPGIVGSLGASYKPIKKLELHGGFYNLGFINWTNNIGTSATLDTEIINIEDRLDSIYVDLKREEDPEVSDYQTGLPGNLFLSAEYFYNDNIAFGVLLEPYFARKEWFFNTSVSANFQVKKWFAATINYNIINNDFTSFGTGLNVNLGPVQLYAVTDNLLGLFGQGQNVHVAGGLNFVFGTRAYNIDQDKALKEQFEVGQDTEVAPSVDKSADPGTNTNTFKFRAVVLSSDRTTEVDRLTIDVYQRFESGSLEKVYTTKVKKNTFTLALDPDAEYYIWLKSEGYEDNRFKLERNPDTGKLPNQQTIYMAPEGTEGKPPAPVPVPEDKTPKLDVPEENEAKEELENQAEELIPTEKKEEAEEMIEENIPEKQDIPQEIEENTAQPEIEEPVVPEPKPETPSTPDANIGDQLTVTSATILQDVPNESGKSLARFFPGDKVELIEKTSKKWWKVSFKNKEGWVQAAFLKQ